MRILNCNHSMIGDCVFCRIGRKQISGRKAVLTAALAIGLLVAALAFWR